MHLQDSWTISRTQVAGPEANAAIQHGAFVGPMIDTAGNPRLDENLFHSVPRGSVEPKPLNPDRQSIGVVQRDKRPLPSYGDDGNGDTKWARISSPKQPQDRQAKQTPFERVKTTADALNSRYNPTETVQPTKSQSSSTSRPDMMKQTAAAGMASRLHLQNASWLQHSTWAAIPENIKIFLGSEMNRAIQKIMKAVADTTVAMEQRLASVIGPCEVKLEQLFVELEHASQKLKNLAKECEAATRSLHMEQLKSRTEKPVEDRHRKLLLLASRLQYVEAVLGIGEGRGESDDQSASTEDCTILKPDSNLTLQDPAAV
ncbi:MAG: hypothetical protein Q9209_001939 [Squamulea sp. 1 TL-2023]